MEFKLINKISEEVVYFYNTTEKKPTFKDKAFQERYKKTLNDPDFHAKFFANPPSPFRLDSYEWKLFEDTNQTSSSKDKKKSLPFT